MDGTSFFFFRLAELPDLPAAWEDEAGGFRAAAGPSATATFTP
jgi:hypothetical protein